MPVKTASRSPLVLLGASLGLGLLVGSAYLLVVILNPFTHRGERPEEGYFPLTSNERESSSQAREGRFSIEELRRDPKILATDVQGRFREDLMPRYLEAQSYELEALGMSPSGNGLGETKSSGG